MTERAYCRVYYTIKDDEKFDGIREDDHHLATWLRLLIIADAIWPASPDLPSAARKASVKALVDAKIVDLLPGGRFRIHGLDAERGARRDAARSSVAHRTYNDRSTNVPTDVSEFGYSHSEPSQAEPSRAKTESEPRPTPARLNGPEPIASILPRLPDAPVDDAFGVNEDEHRVFAYLARLGAVIRPDTGLGRRLLGLLERRGVEDVMRQAGVMAKSGERFSDRQWVFGLEDALEAVPSGKASQAAERQADLDRAHQARLERTRQANADFLEAKS